MKSFSYTAKDEYGMHARPASLLVKEASKYKSNIFIFKGDQKADCKRLFNVISLAIKQHEIVTFTIEGADEEEAGIQLESFCHDNF